MSKDTITVFAVENTPKEHNNCNLDLYVIGAIYICLIFTIVGIIINTRK